MRLLTLVALATSVYALASLRATREKARREDALVDTAIEDSFPASDPPSFSADLGAQAVPGPTS